MTRFTNKLLIALAFACAGAAAFAQGAPSARAVTTGSSADLPLVGVSLYSSGVGYFVHRGTVTGDAALDLEFDLSSINDVLKSLTVYDPSTSGVSVSYDSEDTLDRTLKSLKVDLSGAPSLGEMLAGLRGASITVLAPEKIEGRILGAERVDSETGENWHLSLMTASGIRRISLAEVVSLSFSDSALAADLTRALDVLSKGSGGNSRKVRLSLPGKGTREVTVAYVLPVPVWKASYRLDLGRDKPAFQGWAIVDNAGSADWKAVRLALMSGKPVSFVQNLYNPFYLERPVLPLSIAGFAEAQTYDSGYESLAAEYDYDEYSYAKSAAPAAPSQSVMRESAPAAGASFGVAGSVAKARAAGELFEFTLPGAVTLDRRMSTMVPLVDAEVTAERVSIFSGSGVSGGGSAHPMLAARLENTTGMKLPAGPVTVFDGGTYAGDALLEFLPEKDARLLAYGEDTAVTGWSSRSASQETVSVKVLKGVMTISRKRITATAYTFENSSTRARKLVLEHPITGGATLSATAKPDEQTDSLYRFTVAVPAGKGATFTVREETPVSETVALDRLRTDALLVYSTNRELPEAVRNAIAKAVEFRRRADDAQTDLTDLQGRRADLVREQERIRLNLAAAGNTTQQGKEYLARLTQSDAAIADLDKKIDGAKKSLADANAAYQGYLAGLSF